jgi:hypothetical protein
LHTPAELTTRLDALARAAGREVPQ